MRLWLLIVAAIFATVALCELGKWGAYEGRKVAYHIRLNECLSRYPRYRCLIVLDEYNPEGQR